MDSLIFITTLAIFAETSFLVIRKYKPIKTNQRKIYVDTSVLIDGRILGIAKTGFINDTLIIPKSVLLELQLLADGKDNEKRNRARAGLEVAAELERVLEINTEILDDDNLDNKKVDEKLLKLAKENHGTLLTLDYNLLKVANAEKIPTLNINDLALSVRNQFIPGERKKIKILSKGSLRSQGIGHLKDGTMVVVDKASAKIGTEVLVEFVNFRETSAGKMIFAKIVKE